MKKKNNKICILLCLLIALALENVQSVNASPSLGITLTLYSNSNNKKDTGHAWISITNNTKGTINIGPYSVKRGQCVYIDARGNAEHIFASSQDKRKGDFNGRTYINYISMASSVYKSYAYVSKDITFEDLDMIFYKMKNYQTYDLLANNCTNFAKDIWNSVKNKSKSISKSFTGIEAPQALKYYILNKMGGKSGSNIKGSSDCYFVTPLGNLVPYTIPTVTGFQGKRNGNTATFTWNGIRKEIGANQYNITGYQIEYTDTASKSTKTVNVSGTKTSASINGLNPSRNYVFKVRGICDYSSQGNGSFNVGDFSNSVSLRGNSTKKASLKLNKSKISMYITESTKVKATASGKSKKVTWKSSNSSIAVVNSKGKITAKKAGTCKITATANGKKATCTVTVKNKSKKYIDIEKVSNMTAPKAAAVLGLNRRISNTHDVFYTKNGRTGDGSSYIWCSQIDITEKGMWTFYAMDKSISLYGAKVGMSKNLVHSTLLKRGWQKSSDSINNVMHTGILGYDKGVYHLVVTIRNNKVLRMSYYNTDHAW